MFALLEGGAAAEVNAEDSSRDFVVDRFRVRQLAALVQCGTFFLAHVHQLNEFGFLAAVGGADQLFREGDPSDIAFTLLGGDGLDQVFMRRGLRQVEVAVPDGQARLEVSE